MHLFYSIEQSRNSVNSVSYEWAHWTLQQVRPVVLPKLRVFSVLKKKVLRWYDGKETSVFGIIHNCLVQAYM